MKDGITGIHARNALARTDGGGRIVLDEEEDHGRTKLNGERRQRVGEYTRLNESEGNLSLAQRKSKRVREREREQDEKPKKERGREEGEREEGRKGEKGA